MSAIVCGKRSLFEELPTPPISKKIRCSSSSPVRFSPPRQSNQSAILSTPAFFSQSTILLEHLKSIFPDMDEQLLEKVLAECGDDLDSAIRSLTELRIGSAERNLSFSESKSDAGLETSVLIQSQDGLMSNEKVVVAADPLAPSKNLPTNGADWVELFVREMISSSDAEDARARASRVLEVLEKSISARATAEVAQNFHQENLMLREQVEALVQENTILKRAVSIQHERWKEHENKLQELQPLKQLVSQYQERLRTLEVDNYALTMHLKQAQQSSSIPGHFHPDVF